jgi:hypothetical protein
MTLPCPLALKTSKRVVPKPPSLGIADVQDPHEFFHILDLIESDTFWRLSLWQFSKILLSSDIYYFVTCPRPAQLFFVIIFLPPPPICKGFFPILPQLFPATAGVALTVLPFHTLSLTGDGLGSSEPESTK